MYKRDSESRPRILRVALGQEGHFYARRMSCNWKYRCETPYLDTNVFDPLTSAEQLNTSHLPIALHWCCHLATVIRSTKRPVLHGQSALAVGDSGRSAVPCNIAKQGDVFLECSVAPRRHCECRLCTHFYDMLISASY